MLNEEKSKRTRKFWVSPIFTTQQRLLQGASNNLVKEMEIGDTEKYNNYFRMDPMVMEKLLVLIGPSIAKQHVVRDPIPPETRLHIIRYVISIMICNHSIIRYLASGDSMSSISYPYRVSHNTVSKIISETCEAIWDGLKETVFLKDNPESWQTIADDFEQLWNYPNCIGCIDGKHVNLQVYCKNIT